MYLLFLHIFLLPLKLPDQPGTYLPYLFVAFVPQAVQLILFGGDTIAHSRNRRAIFFQSQFPARYVATVYGVDQAKANFLWFNVFDSKGLKHNRYRTYQYGFTCRLVYYLFYICMFLLLASLLVMGSEGFWQFFRNNDTFSNSLRWAMYANSAPNLKVIYLAHILALASYLRLANRIGLVVQETGKRVVWYKRLMYFFRRNAFKSAVESHKISFRPRGVWFRWEEINNRNKEWMKLNTSDLPSLERLAKSAPASTVESAPTRAAQV
jgi:hypothetical protein